MFTRGFRLVTISGINIRVDYSWLLIFALFIFLLGGEYLPTVVPGAPPVWIWLTAVVTTVLFFGSVVAHELAHSLVARREGIPIHNITLFFFGGVSQLEDEPRSAWDEFRMAIVGPLTSLVLAAIFFVIALLARQGNLLVLAALSYLWIINAALALFNLLPGFPLDGGRVFRAIVWGITRDVTRSTFIAAAVGQGFGWLFIIGGVLGAFFLRGFVFSGLWFALIGWFLISAARSSYQQVALRAALNRVPIREVTNPSVEAVPPDMLVGQLVRDYFLRESASAMPVEEDGRLLGLVSVDDVRRLTPDRWESTPVRAILQPVTGEEVLRPGDDAWDAISRMSRTHRDRMLVVEPDGQVDGIVTRGAIQRWLQIHGRFMGGEAA